ncbi:DUF3060 domain-containing protein [Mycolicibacterium pallens]|uniref:DUF3060 domain-containing protein n=1 Tax=Mycolicibacterium pallens TaxID=370524 RepID=A0ABX8VMJ4_9MYCO|nr:DUF3060 domain-containing protein [Mycolicibacterium pallens]APE15547.1 hypothetical protein BOH72_10330 [Mycobacterium sp. WY10]QYL19019.1 DUF3060 domain-containing protein [Mycolicibacterium pallens]
MTNVGPHDDPQARIADLERQLAEAKATQQAQRNSQPNQWISAPSQFAGASVRRPTGTWRGANLLGAIAGLIGLCGGGASALTAVLPSSALWTSAIVCGAPNQLMVNTSNYSYSPNQSGTTVDFVCLRTDGAHDASWFTITALQSVLVALIAAGAVAVVLAARRVRQNQELSRRFAVTAGVLGVIAVATATFVLWTGLSGRNSPTQMPPGGTLTVDGNGQSKSIACNDGHLTVTGRDMTVTVTGHCARLSIDGVINHITIDSVDAIDVDGLQNVVTYHSGTPTITQSNDQNTVGQN